MAFKLLIGYEVLVIVRPPKGKADLRVQRDGQTIVFENKGNSSVLIRKMEQCAKGEDECTQITGNRLYAGERWELELPETGPVRVYRSFRSDNQVNQY